MDMPKYKVVLRKAARQRAKNTQCYAADFSPAAVLVGWESIVRLPKSVAGNNERTHALFSYMDYGVLESETNTNECEIVRYSFVFGLPKL